MQEFFYQTPGLKGIGFAWRLGGAVHPEVVGETDEPDVSGCLDIREGRVTRGPRIEVVGLV